MGSTADCYFLLLTGLGIHMYKLFWGDPCGKLTIFLLKLILIYKTLGYKLINNLVLAYKQLRVLAGVQIKSKYVQYLS